MGKVSGFCTLFYFRFCFFAYLKNGGDWGFPSFISTGK